MLKTHTPKAVFSYEMNERKRDLLDKAVEKKIPQLSCHATKTQLALALFDNT
jgi:hypothetical protein